MLDAGGPILLGTEDHDAERLVAKIDRGQQLPSARKRVVAAYMRALVSAAERATMMSGGSMPVICIPDKPNWYTGRWGFRMLCEGLENLLDSPEDKCFAQHAEALHILTLDRFDDATEMRLARGLIAAAPVVRSEILAKEKTDQRDHEYADLLLVLERDLRDAYGC